MFKSLIAEDDAELRQLFVQFLTKNGDAAGVCDGAQALTVLEAGYYDRIISDIMMPNVDGYALVCALRDDVKLAAMAAALRRLDGQTPAEKVYDRLAPTAAERARKA